jgi:glutamyl-Q tRNA(Asp) synthetase
MHDSGYRGRFAPSPTGPLHLGSLLTATASFLDARSRGGQWLLRMEDLDPPREVPGAADAILHTLERVGLHWDGEVLYQSRRSDAYQYSLEQLRKGGLVYPCACSRREIRDSAMPGSMTSRRYMGSKNISIGLPSHPSIATTERGCFWLELGGRARRGPRS